MKKTVLVGVSGGIAAYKTCELVSTLVKSGYDVKVVMTKNAAEFVTPLTFETLSKNAVVSDMFAEKPHYDVEHISLAKEGDAFIVAPATANVIAKFASGVADDMLTTTFLANKGIKIICPAMNTNMYESEQNLQNLEKLKALGAIIVEPNDGRLACGDYGKGRMAEPKDIAIVADKLLTPNPDYRGKTVLVTAGATMENIDGVRFISNYSSGKMGAAIADAVTERGGNVVYIAGRTSVPHPKKCRIIEVKSTQDMLDAVTRELHGADVVVMAAAPADYKVKSRHAQKIKTENLTLEFEKNPDIAKWAGENRGNQKLVIFAAETQDLLQNAQQKLLNKNADLAVANDVTAEGAGFGSDTNIVTLLYADGRVENLPKMSKSAVAHCILDAIKE